MPLDAEAVGRTYGSATFEVTPELLRRYADATGDPNPRYRAPDAPAAPVFVVVPATPQVIEACLDPVLRIDVARLVHIGHSHVQHAPLRAGDRLEVTTMLASVRSEPAGDTLVLSSRIHRGGSLAAELWSSMFVRGRDRAALARAARETAATPQGAPVYEQTVAVEEDQPRRYAEVSGDSNPIHLDEAFARSVGFPGVILHGNCTLAIAARAAVDGLCDGDPTLVRRVEARFTHRVVPGDHLTTRLWSGGSGRYAFETYNARGRAVIRQGVVEIGPPEHVTP